MSGQNVEIVREVYEAINAGDEARLEELIDPEVAWVQSPNAPEPRTFHGHDGLRELRGIIDDAFEQVRLEPDEMIGIGERVVALGKMRVLGKGSGAAVEQVRGWVWTLRGGKVVRHETYGDHASALTAAGIQE